MPKKEYSPLIDASTRKLFELWDHHGESVTKMTTSALYREFETTTPTPGEAYIRHTSVGAELSRRSKSDWNGYLAAMRDFERDVAAGKVLSTRPSAQVTTYAPPSTTGPTLPEPPANLDRRNPAACKAWAQAVWQSMTPLDRAAKGGDEARFVAYLAADVAGLHKVYTNNPSCYSHSQADANRDQAAGIEFAALAVHQQATFTGGIKGFVEARKRDAAKLMADPAQREDELRRQAGILWSTAKGGRVMVGGNECRSEAAVFEALEFAERQQR